MPDEYAVGAEAAFGEERVRARERRGRVLMPRQPKPPRRPERRNSGLARGGQVGGVATLGTLRRDPDAFLCLLGFAGGRFDARGGMLAGLPVLAVFPGRFDQCRRMELLPVCPAALMLARWAEKPLLT